MKMVSCQQREVMFCLIVALFCTLLQGVSTEETGGHYTNDFVVEIDGDFAIADLVADTHGFTVEKQLTSVGDGIYHFIHTEVSGRSKRSAEDLLTRLLKDPSVRRVEQQRVLMRVKREVIHDKQVELPIRTYKDKSVYQRFNKEASKVTRKDEIPHSTDGGKHLVFNDRYFADQWYLVNTGQTGGPAGYDVNVESVWKKGITGKGVVVCILDDGIDHSHPDLAPNYDPLASTDLNDKKDKRNDPTPDKTNDENGHGTRCAGEVAAVANNSNCCVGIAYEAKIGGVRMLDGKVTDMLEAQALTFNNQHIDIYSASWGPRDDGKTMEGPGTYVQLAFKKGTTEGRNGKGNIFVWATGNGGENGDDCSADGYVSSIQSISIGSISDIGLSTYFSEVCPSTMAVIFTGGSHVPPTDVDYVSPKLKIVTTDLDGKCTLGFQGTSSAAPLAAGCFALVLQANPELTWRDMQNLVVATSRIPNTQESGWVQNGAGYHVHHKFGFGAIDCGRMVEAAQNWRQVPAQHICEVRANNDKVNFFSRETVIQTLTVTGCHDNPASIISRLEHVQLHVEASHPYRGEITIRLTSPHGTVSEILKPRMEDAWKDGLNFTFMTVHNWGEDPRGMWTINITDVAPQRRQNHSTLLLWSLMLYGSAPSYDGNRDQRVNIDDDDVGDMTHGRNNAYDLNSHQMKKVMDVEAASSDNVQISSGSEQKPNHIAKKTSSARKHALGAYKRSGLGLDSTDRLTLNVLARLLVGDEKDGSKRAHHKDQRAKIDHANEGRANTEIKDNLLQNEVETRGIDNMARNTKEARSSKDAELNSLINELQKIVDKLRK